MSIKEEIVRIFYHRGLLPVSETIDKLEEQLKEMDEKKRKETLKYMREA